MSPLWQITGFLSSALLLLAVWQLQRRSYFRAYPFLALFLLAQVVITVAQWGQLMAIYSVSGARYRVIYWTTEFSTEVLLMMVMVSFIYRALEGTEHRGRTLALVLVASGLAALLGTGQATIGGNRWSSLLARNLSFGSALLNVLLWRALLKYRRTDVQLLLLSLGAGFWTTGRAIGQSLRLISPTSMPVGNAVLVLTEMLSLLVWFWALSQFQLPASRTSTNEQPTTPA